MSSGVEATGSFRRLLKHFAMLGGGKTAAGLTGLVYLAIAAKALGAQQLGVLVLIHAYALAFAELVSFKSCLLYTSPSPRDATLSRMPSSA